MTDKRKEQELQVQRNFTTQEQRKIYCVAYDKTCETGNECKQKKRVFKDRLKYKQALNEACKFLDKATCSCPYDSINEKISNCNVYDCKDQLAECWKEYFLKKASV